MRRRENLCWYPTADEGFQCAHFALGWAVVVTAAIHGQVSLGVLAVVLFVLLKEFVFDFVVERDSVAGSVKDFVFYCLGAGFGLLVK